MTGSGIYNEHDISRVVSAWSGPVQWVCLLLVYLQSTVLTNPCILVVGNTPVWTRRFPSLSLQVIIAFLHIPYRKNTSCAKSRTGIYNEKIYNEISDLEKVSRPGTRNYIVIWTTLIPWGVRGCVRCRAAYMHKLPYQGTMSIFHGTRPADSKLLRADSER